jgi:hypothetical protein
MNMRLQFLLNEAEGRLAQAEQDRLAELVETFLATTGPEADFTAQELADLRALEAAPVELASGEEGRVRIHGVRFGQPL